MLAKQGSPVTAMTPTIAVTPELALMPPKAVTPATTVTQKTLAMMSTTPVTQEAAVCPQSFAEIHEKSFKWQIFILLILRVS